jgi:serine/threonine protein kinase
MGRDPPKQLEASPPVVERHGEMNPNTVIESPTRRYIVKGVRCEGDLATIYNATYANGSGENNVVLKVTRDKDDSDLVWNEMGILGFMFPPSQSQDGLYKYLPRLLDSFETKDKRRVNVFAPIDGYVTLQEVLQAYPKGLNFRDVVWMYKRLLVAIGFAHSKGIIHGAVLPPHVLIHPVEHGAKLIDWSYALNFASIVVPKTKAADPAPKAPHKSHNAWEKLLEDAEYDPDPVNLKLPKGPSADPNHMYIRAMSIEWESYYAPEILVKRTPMPCTDIYMAAKIAVALLGGDTTTNQMPDTVPTQIKAFLQASLLPATRARTQDAWDLHEALDKLLYQLVGKPTYRPFTMPPKN